MQRNGRTVALLVLFASLRPAFADGSEQQASPAKQFEALRAEYQTASSSGVALSDEERMKFVGHVYQLRNKLALKCVELAEKYPDDPVALDALLQAVWQVNGTPWPVELVGRDEASGRALALLEHSHLGSDKLGETCQRIAFGFRREYESLLRATYERSPHRSVRAEACLALAHFLNSRQQQIELLRDQPQRTREFADLFGKDYLEKLLRQDRAQAAREAETLLERAVQDYGDVEIQEGGTVREKAEIGLFELRNLVVGREAPNIEGQDQDGVRFALADYRGKVVLLDFWSEY